jgi:hypothetical protein
MADTEAITVPIQREFDNRINERRDWCLLPQLDLDVSMIEVQEYR